MSPEEYVEHFRARVLADAIQEATSAYWVRRAEAFEDARPRVGDHHGHATRDDLRARWHELTGIATACRTAATLARYQCDVTAEVVDAIREAA